jgi:ribosome biogenesis GTPase
VCRVRGAFAPLDSETTMTSEIHDRLRRIGYSNLVGQNLAQLPTTGSAMRVLEVHRDSAVLHDGAEEHRAQMRPSLARELDTLDSHLAVGDWVLAADDSSGGLWISARMAPLNQLVRRTSEGARQCLVSNVDSALLVMGLDGDFNLRRLERYLTLVRSAQVWPVVVLTKRDLADHGDARCDETRRRIPSDVPIHAVDARVPAAALELSAYLATGQTLVLLGSSGAGKSTLTNSLLGRAEQVTGAVREDDSRGRHTTTVRSLHLLAGGACVIDTPGLRGLRADTDEEGLNTSFRDIVGLAEQCRFRDCQHDGEPGCAVRAQIDPDRLANFHKMRREIRRETMTLLDRRKQLAEWKARGRAAEQRMKMKRG